jgi:hypothetical protein
VAVPHDLVREFDTWLSTNFPQIEFPKHRPSVSAIAFFAHHSLSLIVVLVRVAILTDFKAGSLPAQILLFLAIAMDPVRHCTLALLHCWLMVAIVISGSVVVKFIVLIFNVSGCFVTLNMELMIFLRSHPNSTQC